MDRAAARLPAPADRPGARAAAQAPREPEARQVAVDAAVRAAAPRAPAAARERVARVAGDRRRGRAAAPERRATAAVRRERAARAAVRPAPAERPRARGGAVGGSGGATAGTGGGAGAGGTGGVAVDPVVARGQYLVNSVLGCAGCHTPQGGALLSGTDCFVKSGATGCLSSANLTNDPSGLMNFTDQQIKDAFRKGIDPADSTKFLFANMPYYQFGPLTDTDANAIVAYLRSVPGVSHTVQAPTAPFDVQPAAAEWAAVDPTALPSAGSAAGPANGKYLATLACATCHTANATGTPTHIDAAKAFQGGKIVTTTVSGASKMVQTSNLTPDATGLMTWNVSQVAAAITTAKDKNGTAICGMRSLANMTASDAIDIGTYLLSIPAVANTITMTCQ